MGSLGRGASGRPDRPAPKPCCPVDWVPFPSAADAAPAGDDALQWIRDRPTRREIPDAAVVSLTQAGSPHSRPASMILSRNCRVRSSFGSEKICAGGPSSWTTPP